MPTTRRRSTPVDGRRRLMLDLSKVSTGETRGITKSRASREAAEHKFFDDLVSEAYEEFLEEGEPAAVADRPGRYVEVPDRTDTIETVHKLVTASAKHLNVGVRFGDVEEVGRGRVRVPFTVQHRKNYTGRTTHHDDA